MSQLFGTDGIRRRAEEFTPEFLWGIARGLVKYGGESIKVLIGGDTRESSEWIIRELEAAFAGLGVEYGSVGVLSTPAINYVFYEMGFDFAIDVTASHNAYVDNGIKIFERGEKSGVKLSEDGRGRVEAEILAGGKVAEVADTPREELGLEARELYESHLRDYVGEADFSGLKIGVDCANGATSVIGGRLFEELLAEVTVINAEIGYGKKINDNCGSTHLEALQKLAVDKGLDFGVAFDGDGDRVLMVDGAGEVVDGDEIMVILAGYLGVDRLATTVMANQGLLLWAKKSGVKLEITAVGDQYVAAAMRKKGILLGGEQSGHVILPGESTGDGMLTALMVAKAVAESRKSLAQLKQQMTKFPQVIHNMPANNEEKSRFEQSKEVKELLSEYDKKLADVKGRMLVRPSGTERLIRITMWGENEGRIVALAEELAEKLKEVL